MPNLELLKETSSQIRKDFHLENDEIAQIDNFAALKFFLSNKIRTMLSVQMPELLNLMYRIDLDEKKVKNAFKLLSEEEISEHLAELIIEREVKKAKTRKLYRP